MNALVTGATKGIGRAIALKLAENGYNLSICARNKKELNEFAVTLENLGVKVVYAATDCSDKLAVERFCEFTSKELGAIDVLINNAGTFLPGSLLDEAEENFHLQLSLNLNAPYILSRFFGKAMRDRQSGHIFNICSIASKEIVKNAGSYSVTKAALLSLNNVLRQELAPYNVKVTAILPGSTYTASWDGTTLPKEQFVQPEDIANTIDAILKLSVGVNVDEVILKPQDFKM
ncbi:3-oxoacyl-[acyl-carrier protein] reductase [Pedobacter sp. CG_S7]|uniref:SDR family oxidoreductase n=1 Tax=Pedobacter sp. CG_S7 TaxID=3143930 RepID=UPI003397B2E0